MSGKDIIIQDKGGKQPEKPANIDEQKAIPQPEKPMADSEFKPVIFFSQSEKLMIGNPDLQKEEHFSSGHIAKEEALIRFEGHFFVAKTKQEYDVIMKCYPPAKDKDGKERPNRFVAPVSRDFVAKYNKEQYEKRQGVRTKPRSLGNPSEIRTPDINAEEAVSKLD